MESKISHKEFWIRPQSTIAPWWGPAWLQTWKYIQKRARGRRTHCLCRLRKTGLRSPLTALVLANVRSLCNKTDGLKRLLDNNRDIGAVCLTETWLSPHTPDFAVTLPGYGVYRAEREFSTTGKKRGGGGCFYVNDGWCNDVSTISKHCSAVLDSVFINWRPFYSPLVFASIVLVCVYIAPQANAELPYLCMYKSTPDFGDLKMRKNSFFHISMV